MSGWSLTSDEFYTAIAEYLRRVDPRWAEEWMSPGDNESENLHAVLGQAKGQRVLDCSCGTGAQAILLAKLGWQVEAFGLRRRALRRAQLEQHLQQVGFQGIEHLSQVEWKPYEFVAGKPLNSVF